MKKEQEIRESLEIQRKQETELKDKIQTLEIALGQASRGLNVVRGSIRSMEWMLAKPEPDTVAKMSGQEDVTPEVVNG